MVTTDQATDQVRRRFLSYNLSKARARRRPARVLVTVDELMEIGKKQKWRCAITGDPLEFVRGGTYNNNNSNAGSCSIDRIDSSGSYEASNIQLVTWQSNLAKSGMTMTQLKEWVSRANRRLRRLT